MNKYTVKSGQNLYDIALAIYGSIEGVFDLLMSNPDISYETVFSKGAVLNYHEDFIVNDKIVDWLQTNDVVVKNGNHNIINTDVAAKIKEWVEKNNAKATSEPQNTYLSHNIQIHQPNYWLDEQEKVEAVAEEVTSGISLPTEPNELAAYYDSAATPKIKIIQSGRSSEISLQVPDNCFVAIDWGDDAAMDFVGCQNKVVNIAHTYDDLSEHTILIYGHNQYVNLDFTKVSGVYYALSDILVQEHFSTPYPNATMLNKLFITQNNE